MLLTISVEGRDLTQCIAGKGFGSKLKPRVTPRIGVYTLTRMGADLPEVRQSKGKGALRYFMWVT